MVVNPFWMGVLMTIVAELMVLIVFAWVNSHRVSRREKAEEDAFFETLGSLEGKKVRIVRKNGYLIGEAIDDEDDKEG